LTMQMYGCDNWNAMKQPHGAYGTVITTILLETFNSSHMTKRFTWILWEREWNDPRWRMPGTVSYYARNVCLRG
jgi:hypothetical protein